MTVQRIAERHERQLRAQIVAETERMQARVTDSLVAADMVDPEPRRLLALLDDAVILKADQEQAAIGLFARILADAANQTKPPIKQQMTVKSPAVLAAAKRLAARLIVQVSGETKAAVREIVQRAVSEGIDPRRAARLIREVVGLTRQQAGAVERLAQTMRAAGVKEELVQRRTARYAKKQLRRRSILIARTETLTAANRGQKLAWKQAREEGLLGDDFRMVWITTPDDRLCPECAPMDGLTVDLDDTFTQTQRGVLPSQRVPFTGPSVETPPLHPGCRCTVGAA